MKTVAERFYDKYVKEWKKEHTCGFPACFDEWRFNEYAHGYSTNHNRTGKYKRPNKFYTKEFRCGNTVLTRGDLETLPVSMDTYDFTDKDMQYLVEQIEIVAVRKFGKNYNLMDEDVSRTWYLIVEANANYLGMNYYEDYDEDIEE